MRIVLFSNVAVRCGDPLHHPPWQRLDLAVLIEDKLWDVRWDNTYPTARSIPSPIRALGNMPNLPGYIP